VTRVCVVAPVRERAWIIPTWLWHIDLQRSADVEVDIAVFYEGEGDGLDDGTYGLLAAEGERADHQVAILSNRAWRTPRDDDDVIQHRWRCSFYRYLAKLRNALQDWVESAGTYDYVLSIDSDILLSRGALPRLIEDAEKTGGIVGPLVNLDPAPWCIAWNYMTWDKAHQGWAERRWAELLPLRSGVHEVDVLMACSLAPLGAGELPRWQESAQCEDVGWSENALAQGRRLYVDTDLVARHVMNRRELPDPWAVEPAL
jgi:hypothetical protein